MFEANAKTDCLRALRAIAITFSLSCRKQNHLLGSIFLRKKWFRAPGARGTRSLENPQHYEAQSTVRFNVSTWFYIVWEFCCDEEYIWLRISFLILWRWWDSRSILFFTCVHTLPSYSLLCDHIYKSWKEHPVLQSRLTKTTSYLLPVASFYRLLAFSCRQSFAASSLIILLLVAAILQMPRPVYTNRRRWITRTIMTTMILFLPHFLAVGEMITEEWLQNWVRVMYF